MVKKREENIFDQRVVKRKTGKYIRSTSGEKKERKIYAIKSRVGARWCTGQMQSHLKECSQRWKKLDWNRFPLSQSLLVLDPTTSCALVFESHNPFFLLQKLFLLFKKDNPLYWGSQIYTFRVDEAQFYGNNCSKKIRPVCACAGVFHQSLVEQL